MWRWLGCLGLAWLLLVGGVLWIGGDRVWWSVPFLFGPRWFLALPFIAMIPWLFTEFRRALVPVVAGLVLATVAICGWRPGLQRSNRNDAVPVRVLELNAAGGNTPAVRERIATLLRETRPELVVIAECGQNLRPMLAQFPGYQFRSDDALCLLSRDEIVEWTPRDQHDLWRQSGAGAIVRAVVRTAGGLVRIGLVHLATPRNALDAYRDLSELPRQDAATRANIALRELESSKAHDWIFSGPALPTIVAGDFNLPVESAIYRRHWGPLRNAYGRAGRGTGYTKHTRFWGVRIDHVLTTSDIDTHAVTIGRDVGVDHVPVIADLLVPRGR